jgi:acylphosphatase
MKARMIGSPVDGSGSNRRELTTHDAFAIPGDGVMASEFGSLADGGTSGANSAGDTSDQDGVAWNGDRIRRIVTIAGRVQGVRYRISCAAEARRLGVAGTVRNLPDGTVIGDFEGPSPIVESLIAWCRIGPERATVTAVDVVTAGVAGYEGFRIL